jgi:hypothetical protein
MNRILIIVLLLSFIFCESKPKMSISFIPFLDARACINRGKMSVHNGEYPECPPILIIRMGQDYVPDVDIGMKLPTQDIHKIFKVDRDNCYSYEYTSERWPPSSESISNLIKRDYPQFLTKAKVYGTEEAKNIIPEYYIYLWGFFHDPRTNNKPFYAIGIYRMSMCN